MVEPACDRGLTALAGRRPPGVRLSQQRRRRGGATGFTTAEIELDLSLGGGYRFGMQPPDAESFHFAGEFIEIDLPSLLVYTFRWEVPDPDDQETVVMISLDAIGDTMHVSICKASSRPRHGGATQ